MSEHEFQYGCHNCEFRGIGEDDYPCNVCSNNYTNQWTAKHKMTYMEAFIAAMENAGIKPPMHKQGKNPAACRAQVFGGEMQCHAMSCSECWNQEVER